MQLPPPLSAVDAFREKQRRNGKCRKDAFSESDERFLAVYYPNTRTKEIARILNRSKKSIIAKACKMGLRKNPEVVSKMASENNRGENHHQYGKQVPLETRLKISKSED
jgi:23S rRNA G2069 N7-methylase RlmK/C1962 C5-methylase RlmI